MASRRGEIQMSDQELREFIGEQMVMQVATVGPDGRPHLVPLWYVPGELELAGWTYAKSQKGRNLERDPHATVGIEDGVEYHELRGVMMQCDVELERDAQRVGEIGLALYERYTDGALTDEIRQMVEKQAPKRFGLRFRPTRVVTWDHRKLQGVY
jgi:PPOX class probable F420-dependent enzyme